MQETIIYQIGYKNILTEALLIYIKVKGTIIRLKSQTGSVFLNIANSITVYTLCITINNR